MMKYLPLLTLLIAQPLMAQLPTGTELSIAPGIGSLFVNITEPGNHVWVLQSSPNLSNWTDIQTMKIHNGRYRRTFSTSGLPSGFFYQASINSAGQTLTSTTASALLIGASPPNYASPTLPPSFAQNPIPAQDNTPVGNPTTDTGAELGRVLFYDKRLSINQTISCSSCHQQAHGFSDPHPFSVGFAGGLTDRNSMGLAHARWYQRRSFFWDERAATLEIQVLQPIQNSVEMGMTLPALETRLNAEPYYTDLFNRVFGTPVVTSDRISRALAQFVRSIVSVQSKYDVGAASGFTNFTAEENQGRQIFNTPTQGNCAACHGTDNFVPGGGPANNNGIENPSVDRGIGAITGLTTDDGKFKVPSLRNIEPTAPFMHDGRFNTLEQVVEFYNSGVAAHPNLSPPLRNPPGQGPPGSPRRLNLTVAQKAALVAFMKTLTDPNLATNPKYSDPFNYGD
jgi:cytochrome c peroxidase